MLKELIRRLTASYTEEEYNAYLEETPLFMDIEEGANDGNIQADEG